jgi:hypothetical protein
MAGRPERFDGGVIASAVLAGCGPIRSDSCHFADLLSAAYSAGERDRQVLDLAGDWAKRWSVTWKVPGAEVVCAVADAVSFPVTVAQPVRRFSWGTSQRHRPGLQFLVSTGRHHGFESIAEQRLLLVLDFAAGVIEVISQPLRMRFPAAGGPVAHIPEFLVITRGGTWLIDVRPGDRIAGDDRVKFAASGEVALACGWRYLVVTGWRPQALAVVDTLASQRLPLTDPLGIQGELLTAAGGGPLPFGELVNATSCPALARAHALHLLWHRRLGIDLATPLSDETHVWAARAGSGR